MTKETKDKKFMIIEKEIFLGTPKYSIHKSMMYDLTTATKILVALDTLNEDREDILITYRKLTKVYCL